MVNDKINNKEFLDELSSYVGKDLAAMPVEKRQKVINQSRNYLRFKMTKYGGNHIPANHPLLTPRESEIIRQINDAKDRVRGFTIEFYSEFYDNCPQVGSTLKRKEKKIPNLITIDNVSDFI